MLLSLPFRRILLLGALLAFGGVAAIAVANWWILSRTRGQRFAKIANVPTEDVGVVLGTTPHGRKGRWKNPFFENRMDAAARLYRAGKVRHLLLTGDNSTKDYDEVTAMREALVARGVPASATTLDHAGFRTLDSMARARRVFGVQRAIVITDDFHLPRALFLAQVHGLKATGYQSQPVPYKWSKKTRLREIASRVAACLDVYVLRTKPKFYGPPVTLPLAQR